MQHAFTRSALARCFVPLTRCFVPLARCFVPLARCFVPLARCFVPLALSASACAPSPARVSFSLTPSAESNPNRIRLFTRDPELYEASLRALGRMQTAIGEPCLSLAAPEVAADCEPHREGCGFALSFKDVVRCHGNPEPALACTSLGGGGKTLGIAMQAELRGEELDNRVIHELFHVITLNRAEHSVDGLFMEYSLGHERISSGTLESVCAHFPCEAFSVEEDMTLSTASPFELP